MSLSSGTKIGIYAIVSKLGEGGMGEVYVARDTRLDRDVALKVLPELFTSDPDRLARFEREAKVLASLNHPNIAQVYGFEGNAIAMELVDGETLEEIIRGPGSSVQGPASVGLPLDRVLPIMRQIAIALEAAHDQGIIHRDLKPANVKVREDGTVKVLDFGLAKAFAADAESAASVSNSPTLTARSTQMGMILGTAAYMAPEQAKGRPVDRRADVWAFGVVFFEMLAGRRAFEGDDVSEVLASVLKMEPEWSALPADLPGPVRRLLRRCLEKDPKKRLRDVAEGMLQLEEGLASGSTSSIMMPAAGDANGSIAVPAVPQPLWRRALPIAASVVLTAGAYAGITAWMAPPPADPPTPVRFQHEIPPASPMWVSGDLRDLTVSPDGKVIVFAVQERSGSPELWVRRLDQLEGAPLRGAEGAGGPFVSPDNQWVGFVDSSDRTAVKKVSILGGPPVPLTRLPAAVHGASWMTDGTIVFGMRGGPLQSVSQAGGEPVAFTKLDSEAGDVEHLWPAEVPGTSVVLFVTGSGTTPALGGQLAAFDRATGRIARLKLAGVHPRYLPTGHIVYAVSDGSLRTVAFDVATMTAAANTMPVLEGVAIKPTGAANFDISRDGALVYGGGGNTMAALRTITWTSRTGKETAIAADPRNYYYARISPDGSRLSLDARDQEQDIWIFDIRREHLDRLTDTPGADQYGLWAAGGQRVVFNSEVKGKGEIFQMRPDGTGEMEQLTDTSKEKVTPYPNAITANGKQVIFRGASGVGKNDLWISSATGDRSVSRLLASEHDERNATLSPDGKWMAYESDDSGKYEVYVRPFPDVNSGKSPVSTGGGTEPLWSPTGKEIFYVSEDNRMMAVPVSTASGFVAEKPVVLFDTLPYYFGGQGRNYDVTRDGLRFVMVKNPPEMIGRSMPIHVVLNWAEELRAKIK